MKITFDGRVLEGTPLHIVQSMRALSPFTERQSIPEYVSFVTNQINALGGDLRPPENGTDEDRAKALVDAMISSGMARVL